MRYRSEIDGLRAIAIISVILYHAQFKFGNTIFFSGGFVGVDIFFVISGYLITRILFKNSKRGFYEILKFFEKRIRRILPALIFMFLVFIPVSYFYLIPSSLIKFSESLLSSIIFISNFYFFFDGLEYGTQDSLLKPLLHTWSLSVEEQFYLIFPILLIFFTKYIKETSILKILTIIIILNFLFLNLSGNLKTSYPFHNSFDEFKFFYPTKYFDFYFLTSRFWELLVGSTIVFIENKRQRNIYDSYLVFLGLILIILSIIFFNQNTVYPSYYTLVPVLGTFLIILYANSKNVFIKILSNKMFVFIGLISYSLYIWHYPIFSFYRISNATYELSNLFFIFIILIFISTLSYYFVETPFRNKSFSKSKLFIFILTSVSFILIFSVLSIKTNGFSHRLGNNNIQFDNEILRKKSWSLINNEKTNFPLKKIYNENVLFLGDSHSKDMFNIFFQNRHNFENYNFYRSKLYLEKDLNFNLKIIQNDKNYINSKIIIFSAKFKNKDLKLLEDLIKIFIKDKKKVILFSRSDEFKSDYKHKLERFYLQNLTSVDKYLLKNIDTPLNKETIKKVSKILYQNRMNNIDTINVDLKKLSIKHKIQYLSKRDYLCNEIEKICHGITDDGHKIFFDYGHYTLEGARFFGKKIIEQSWFDINNN